MTIKDIAKQCSVSVSTVSRVLNGKPDVSDDVRRKVQAVIDACNYIPNDSARILIPMDELIDREKELARLEKERESCKKDIAFVSGKLNNAGFVAKAPEKVVAAEREKLQKAEEKLAIIEESIRKLG